MCARIGRVVYNISACGYVYALPTDRPSRSTPRNHNIPTYLPTYLPTSTGTVRVGVEEVMRACGGAVAGVKEAVASDAGGSEGKWVGVRGGCGLIVV